MDYFFGLVGTTCVFGIGYMTFYLSSKEGHPIVHRYLTPLNVLVALSLVCVAKDRSLRSIAVLALLSGVLSGP